MKQDLVKKLTYKYQNFITRQQIGGWWIGQVRGYFPITQLVQEIVVLSGGAFFIQRWLPWFNVSMPMIITYVLVKNYGWLILNAIVAHFAIKRKVYEAQQQFGAKNEALSPYNVELIKQLEAIGEKLGIESNFTKL